MSTKPRAPRIGDAHDGLTFEEIAKRLDMPPSTVKFLAKGAIRKMRAVAEEEGLSFEALFEERSA